MLSSKGFMCNRCLSALYPKGLEVLHDNYDFTQRHETCKCGNLSIIWDEDVTPRLYVDDITTVRPIRVFHKDDYEEVQRELLAPLSVALYAPLDFKDQPLTYQHLAKKNKYIRKTSTTYNDSLIHALDRHNHRTSDGNEEFLRTTLSNPLKTADS